MITYTGKASILRESEFQAVFNFNFVLMMRSLRHIKNLPSTARSTYVHKSRITASSASCHSARYITLEEHIKARRFQSKNGTQAWFLAMMDFQQEAVGLRYYEEDFAQETEQRHDNWHSTFFSTLVETTNNIISQTFPLKISIIPPICF